MALDLEKDFRNLLLEVDFGRATVCGVSVKRWNRGLSVAHKTMPRTQVAGRCLKCEHACLLHIPTGLSSAMCSFCVHLMFSRKEIKHKQTENFVLGTNGSLRYHLH